MYQIIYVSSAREGLSKTQLIELLAKSRATNERLGISGLLLYKEGSIMQLIEGERSIVESLYAKISQDPRHGGLIVLFRGEVVGRDFPDWSMGFRDLASEEVREIHGYNQFLNTTLGEGDFAGSGRAAKLFSIFKR